MATCETNGFINYVSAIVTGSTVLPVSKQYNSAVGDEHRRDLKTAPTLMPPRSDYLLNCSITFGETSVDCHSQPDPKKSPHLLIHNSVPSVSPPKSDEPACSESRLDPSHTPADGFKSSPSHSHLQSPASRFRAYKQRLNRCTDRLRVVRSRCNTILTHLLSSQTLANQQSVKHDVPGDETESSTDDEMLDEDEADTDAVSSPALSSSEETWLCTRAITTSNWFWFLSELRRCRLHVSRLNAIKSHCRLSRLSVPPTVSPDSCSRATPWVCGATHRRTHHDLTTVQFGSMSHLPSLTGMGAADGTTRCSCILPYSGPCIKCFDQSSKSLEEKDCTVATAQTVDLLAAARPLGAHIHPKLSLPRDIQLSLRLESRLAAFSPVTFREHKTTIHAARHCPLRPRPTSLVAQLGDYGKRLYSSSFPSTSSTMASSETREPLGEKCHEESEHD